MKYSAHSGFIAYVPKGSIAKGKALAGLQPIYIARQLYPFRDGTRNGVDAQLMKKPIAHLTDDDILATAAYLASLAP